MKTIERLLVVDRDRFRLTLYDLPPGEGPDVKYENLMRFPIAVGAAGTKTPRGLYRINTKAKDPDWRMPDSPWVPKELRGTVVPGNDPANPIKARWLGIYDGVGIHGTAEEWSIGHAASHGCIRMLIPDVIALYPEVPKGTPVFIV